MEIDAATVGLDLVRIYLSSDGRMGHKCEELGIMRPLRKHSVQRFVVVIHAFLLVPVIFTMTPP